MIAYKGDIVFAPTPDRFEVVEDGYAIVDGGTVQQVCGSLPAGNDSAMNRQIVMAIEASKAKTFESGHADDRPLRLPEAFHMATKVGGALFGKVGSFEPGYAFDALVIREGESLLSLSVEERLERFIYTGDDRDIEERYVEGRLVPQPFA